MPPVGQEQVQERRAPRHLREPDLRGELQPAGAGPLDGHLMGADPEDDGAAGVLRPGRREGGPEALDPAVADDARQEVQRRVAEGRGDGQRRRPVVHVRHVAGVLDPALAQDHRRRREGQRLGRIGGGVQDHARRAREHVLQVGAQLFPELVVEVRQRLVQQQHVDGAGQRPGDGGALLLPAGELGGPAPEQFADAHEPGHLTHPPVDLLLREGAVHAQRGGDVLVHRQRRIVDELLIDEGH
nr:hypothetical protein GCM10020093_012260 [Planobispora longispora]